MISARKVPPFNFALHRWLAAVLRRRFHNIYLVDADRLDELDKSYPVVGCVNHTNWWDGFILYVISYRRLPHDIYLAMEEKNLRRYPFFTWMGVFGIDLSGPRAALPGLRYAVRLLRQRVHLPRLAWIFVQGRLASPRAVVEVRPGASFLARQTRAQILPVILRYEWLAESRPSVFVQIGHPLPPDTSAPDLGMVLNGLCDEVETAFDLATPRSRQPLFPESMSMNKRWDYLVHRLLHRRGKFGWRNG